MLTNMKSLELTKKLAKTEEKYLSCLKVSQFGITLIVLFIDIETLLMLVTL